MLTALTRDVSPTMAACELTYLKRQEIDIPKAREQHTRYKLCLSDLGVRLISLPADANLPDAVFVEDPVIVMDEIAVIAITGVKSRRNEAESLAKALIPLRPLHYMREPATLEGGDVMRIGRDVFVGLSPRTNETGVSQLAEALTPFGYNVQHVRMRDCLHLKTACSYIGDDTILLNRAWVDTAPFQNWKLLNVAQEEPWAANALRIADKVLMPAGFAKTENILRRNGFYVQPLDLSELQKAEGSVTCMSVLFESEDTNRFSSKV